MDRRVKYTKKIIKECFFDLLNEKEINKITVSELCTKADINRATFYRYYIDIYDLLEKIQEEFIEELKVISGEKDYTVFSFSKEMLQVFLNNKDLLRIVFKTQNHIYFLNDFLDIAYEKCKNKWTRDIGYLDEKNIEFATTFIFNGAIGVINYWVQNEFTESVDEISTIIEELSYNGIKSYLYNEKKKD